jgi:predicted DNA binding CopG/RHH family protein
MGRDRLPEDERKEIITIRLPKWLIEKIKKQGSIQNYIENLLNKYIKK